MKKIKVTLMVLSLVAVAVACGNSSESSRNSQSSGHENHKHSDEQAEESTPTDLDVSLVKLLNGHYIELQQALANDNGEEAKTVAGKIQETLDTTEDLLGKKLMLDAEHIASTDDLTHQRDHFEVLSKNMIDLNKQVKTGEGLYIVRCPMAFGGKGASWISNEDIVENPYFGSQMPSCGKVQRKI